MRDAWRVVLTSREFWRDFADFYSPAAISARLDRIAEDLRRFNQRGR